TEQRMWCSRARNHETGDFDRLHGRTLSAQAFPVLLGFGMVRPSMKLGIVKETRPGERRVAASPNVVGTWVKAGWQVTLARGAGSEASRPHGQYGAAAATLVGRATAWAADIVLKVRPPEESEVAQLREGATLISFLYPAQNEALVAKLAARTVNVLAMDQVP